LKEDTRLRAIIVVTLHNTISSNSITAQSPNHIIMPLEDMRWTEMYDHVMLRDRRYTLCSPLAMQRVINNRNMICRTSRLPGMDCIGRLRDTECSSRTGHAGLGRGAA
jgi:hypothetical protein